MRMIPVLTLALALLLPAAAGAAICRAPVQSAEIGRELLRAANAQRAAYGLPQLSWDARLAQAAQMKACNLAATRKFAHNARDVRSRVQAASCDFSGPLAENLGHGYLSVKMAVQRWMASSHHRDNMMHPRVRVAGAAWMPEQGGGGYWVMMYAGTCG